MFLEEHYVYVHNYMTEYPEPYENPGDGSKLMWVESWLEYDNKVCETYWTPEKKTKWDQL